MTPSDERDANDLDRVARHMIRCRPCVDMLGDDPDAQALASRWLAAQGPETLDHDTLIEAIARKTVAGGTMALADLIYELAKACLTAEARWRTHVRTDVEPRESGEVSQRVAAIAQRLASFTSDELPARCRLMAQQSAHEEPLPAGRVLLSLLAALEGESYRYRLAQANLETTDRNTALALQLASSVLEDGDTPMPMRLHAYRSAMRAASVGDHLDAAGRLLEAARAEFSDDPVVAINAVSIGYLIGDTGAVERATRVLKEEGALADAWVHTLAEAVALSLHEEVSIPLDEAREACGL